MAAAILRGVPSVTIILALVLASGAYLSAATCDFSSSCRDMYYESGYLYATCKNWIGYNLQSRLYLDNGVRNEDGTLQCGVFSGGGFMSSCSDITITGSTLSAYCTDSSGESQLSSVDLDSCIYNDNSQLRWCDTDSDVTV